MASRIKGLTIEIGGNTTKLQTALKGVNSSIKNTSTALKDVDKLLKFNPTNTDLLRQKQQLLGKQIEDTKKKLDTLKTAQEQMKASGVDKNSEDYQRLQREIIETENKLKSLENSMKQFGSVAGQAIIAAGQKMQDFGKKIADAGRSISQVGSTLTRNVTAPIALVGTAAVKTAADFEQGMAEVAAISGASSQELEQLGTVARQMGTESVFGATEAAEAYKYMAMAGWDATQMMDGLPAVMNLAAASGEDLGMVSDIVTDGLTAFGMGAKDASHFADVLATAASNSNTNVSMMGESFKYAAPVAGALGYSVEDVSLALGLMANSGIKASQAGTTLRTLLTNMSKPTDQMAEAMDALGVSLEDGEGGMLSLYSVLGDLRKGFGQLKIPQEELISGMEELDAAFEEGSLTEKEYADAQNELMERAYGAEGALKAQNAAALAGSRGMSGLLAIVNSSDEDFEKLTKAIRSSDGAAQNMADTMSDTLSGQLKKLKNNAKELGIQFGNVMMPAIKNVVTRLQDLARWLQNLSPKQKEQVVRFAAIAAAVGPVLVAVGKLVTLFGNTVVAIGKLTSGFGRLVNIFATNPFALAAVGAVALAAGITKIVDAMTETPFEAYQAKLQQTNQEMESVRQMTAEYQNLATQRDADVQKVQAQIGYTQSQKAELDGLLSKTGELTEEEKTRANFLATELMNALGIARDGELSIIEQYQNEQTEIDNLMAKMRERAILQANEAMYLSAIQNEASAREAATTAYNAYTQQAEAAAAVTGNYEALVAELAAREQEAAGSANAFGGENEALIAQIAAAKQEMESTQASLSALEQEYIAAEVAASGYSSQIANYETVSAAIASGTEVSTQALNNLANGFMTAGNASAVALAQQVADAQAKYNELKTAAENGYAGVTDASLRESQKAVEAALKEYAKLAPDAKAEVSKLSPELASAIDSARASVVTSSTNVVKGGVKAMETEAKTAMNTGTIQTQQYAMGITRSSDTVRGASKTVATQGVNAATAEARSGAPYSGAALDDGFAQGIRNNVSVVEAAAAYAAQRANAVFRAQQEIRSPSKVWERFGRYTVEGLAIGMEKASPMVDEVVKDLLPTPKMDSLNLDATKFGSVEMSLAEAQRTNPILAKVDALTGLVTNLLTVVQEGGDVLIDKDALVGEITPAMNRRLGLALRGAT